MAEPRRLSSRDPGFDADLAALLAFEGAQDEGVDRAVAEILEDVRNRGDDALIEYTRRFDRWSPGTAADLEVKPAACREALARIGPEERAALEIAAERIRGYHAHQHLQGWRVEDEDGTMLGQQVTALDRVGLYVPGGKAAYPSSVLMNAVAAKVAGVPELVMVFPTPEGTANDHVLAAASLAGVDRVYRVGGAQAVGALAFGTRSIPAVDKIVGPGNAYVAAAKRRVFGRVGIDMVAGPSEILVIADATANADWVAMDLFSQAEHDEIAQSILLTPDAALAERVLASMRLALPEMPRRAIIEASLANRGALIVVRDLDEACAIANRIAPEHLELAVADPDALLPRDSPRRCHLHGALFVGVARRLLRGTQPRAADFTHGALFFATRRLRFPETLEPHSRRARRGGPARRDGGDARARRGPGSARAQRGDALRGIELKFAAGWVRDEIRALTAYHVAPAAGLVKLDAMENPYRLPRGLADELGRHLARVAINRYPDPEAAGLKAALREAMAIPGSLDVVLGNGSDEILQMIAVALAKPGSSMLSLEPSFAMYRLSAISAGMSCAGVPLAADFNLDLPATLAAIERLRPALTWIAYPNNPTGNLFPREAILAIVEASPGLVVVDEAYYAFSGGASFLGEVGRHPNLVVVRTVSKLGLAGLRLGLAVGPRDWLAEFDKVRLPYNVNVLSAAAAQFILERRDVLDAQTAAIVRDRGLLEAGLDAIAGVRRFPSAANFVLVRVPDGPRAFEGLKARGILVRNFHGSHPLLAHCLRLTVGTPEENAGLLAALAQAIG